MLTQLTYSMELLRTDAGLVEMFSLRDIIDTMDEYVEKYSDLGSAYFNANLYIVHELNGQLYGTKELLTRVYPNLFGISSLNNIGLTQYHLDYIMTYVSEAVFDIVRLIRLRIGRMKPEDISIEWIDKQHFAIKRKVVTNTFNGDSPYAT